jgi:hypothetical protein
MHQINAGEPRTTDSGFLPRLLLYMASLNRHELCRGPSKQPTRDFHQRVGIRFNLFWVLYSLVSADLHFSQTSPSSAMNHAPLMPLPSLYSLAKSIFSAGSQQFRTQPSLKSLASEHRPSNLTNPREIYFSGQSLVLSSFPLSIRRTPRDVESKPRPSLTYPGLNKALFVCLTPLPAINPQARLCR